MRERSSSTQRGPSALSRFFVRAKSGRQAGELHVMDSALVVSTSQFLAMGPVVDKRVVYPFIG